MLGHFLNRFDIANSNGMDMVLVGSIPTLDSKDSLVSSVTRAGVAHWKYVRTKQCYARNVAHECWTIVLGVVS